MQKMFMAFTDAFYNEAQQMIAVFNQDRIMVYYIHNWLHELSQC